MLVTTEDVAKLLKTPEVDNVLILTHMNPDGDTIGCGTALCRVLQSLGKKARVENSQELPKKYHFLFDGIEKQDFEPGYIIAVDIADPSLLGDRLSVYKDDVDLCIDHHVSNKGYARKLLLGAEDAAACLTLYRVIKAMDIPVSIPVATDLYTGLSTDTGCFRYSNANAECYRAAAELVELGIDNAYINTVFFETKPISHIRTMTEAMSGLKLYCNGMVSVITITTEMLGKYGASEDAGEFITALSRQIEGVKVGITLKQKADGHFKASVRTHEPVDASAVCALLGGGGHVRAGGCDLPDNAEEGLNIMLSYIAQVLNCEV